jgi:hypothetical protein
MKERAIYYGPFYSTTCYIYVRLLNEPCLLYFFWDGGGGGGGYYLFIYTSVYLFVVVLHNDVIHFTVSWLRRYAQTLDL